MHQVRYASSEVLLYIRITLIFSMQCPRASSKQLPRKFTPYPYTSFRNALLRFLRDKTDAGLFLSAMHKFRYLLVLHQRESRQVTTKCSLLPDMYILSLFPGAGGSSNCTRCSWITQTASICYVLIPKCPFHISLFQKGIELIFYLGVTTFRIFISNAGAIDR